MVDKVFIEGLEIEALIGIYDWERRIRQPLVFDLEMAFDNRKPAASDAIADTLDYKAVSKRLVAFVSESGFGLVETLAERCAELVLREFNVAHVRLKLSKPGAVRGARAVGVVIERRRAALEEDAVAMPEATVPMPASVEAPPLPPPSPEAGSPGTDSVESSGVDAKPALQSAQSPAHPPPPRPRNPAAALGRATQPAYLSLGRNHDAPQNQRAALRARRARVGAGIVSPVYRIPAVGFDGPDFLNAAAIIDSDLDPFALVAWLQGLERAHGRMRNHVKLSSRTLDLDIVYFNNLVLDLPGRLQLPRPELRHAFVLKPLADIAPGFVDPVRGTSLAELWAAHPEHGVAFEAVSI